jgi:predicted RNase H-like HicB family nuclease
MFQLIAVRPDPAGKYTAQVIGIPEVRATAQTEQEAIEEAQKMLAAWLGSSRLVAIEVPTPPSGVKQVNHQGHLDPDHPMEKEYLDELARYRREDLERTIREYDQECSNSSSTPTT